MAAMRASTSPMAVFLTFFTWGIMGFTAPKNVASRTHQFLHTQIAGWRALSISMPSISMQEEHAEQPVHHQPKGVVHHVHDSPAALQHQPPRGKTHPMIIQGGMGIAVSNWELAKTVAMNNQLGIVSGTSMDNVLARRLQDGDPDGRMRRAMEAFPVPEMAERVKDKYFVEGGKAEDAPYKAVPMWQLEPTQHLVELTIVANFVEVWCAKEGHDGLVGINLLTKIQMPTMASLYGAVLADADYVIMGAGIPKEIPGILDELETQSDTKMKISVDGGDDATMHFSPAKYMPAEFIAAHPKIKRPHFLPIVSSVTLAQTLKRKSTGPIQGFVIELPSAGGHNAPPRGRMQLDENGEPIYGAKDDIPIQKIIDLGLPTWVAGSYSSPAKLKQVLAMGGMGVQCGTYFAFCKESGVSEDRRRHATEAIFEQNLRVHTDPVASPTGFPFKVVQLDGTLSAEEEYQARPRVCNLGYLRTAYEQENGRIGYRCPAEPEDAWVKKGGDLADTAGRKCLCNALMSDIGMPQRYKKSGYVENHLLTSGDDIKLIKRFLADQHDEYSAVDVLQYLLGEWEAPSVEQAVTSRELLGIA